MEDEDMQNNIPGLTLSMPYLLRVDKLLSRISEYAINEDYRMMKHSLRALFRELSPYIKGKYRKDTEEHFKQIKKHENLRSKFRKMNEAGSYYDNKLSSEQIQLNYNVHNNKVTELLDKLSIRLMEQVYQLGLLIPKQEEE